jgi:hypothetical protein
MVVARHWFRFSLVVVRTVRWPWKYPRLAFVVIGSLVLKRRRKTRDYQILSTVAPRR